MIAFKFTQAVHTLRFAGLTQGQQAALNQIVAAFAEQQAAAKPFGELAERYAAYKRISEGASPKHQLDFTEWLDRYGEDPDVLFAQFKAVSEGQKDEQDANCQTAP